MLVKIIADQIQESGSISVAEYMDLALAHPQHGYYRQEKILGSAGDFTTSPEISQVFGELIGLWCAQVWKDMGAPSPINLIELGPGRGTLMSDALRAVKVAQHFLDAMKLYFLDINPYFVARQKEKLAAHHPHHFSSLDQLPQGPSLIIANEFFDALPIEQIIFDGSEWRRRVIETKNNELAFANGDIFDIQDIADLIPCDAPKPGDIFEFNPAALGAMQKIAAHLKTNGGAALFIDYGHLQPGFGETFQALRQHAYTNPLQNPGASDLTAHVDFFALSQAAMAQGLLAQTATQGKFLENLGIRTRLARLVTANPAKKPDLTAGVDRITANDKMGTLFKVLCIYPANQPMPAGFI